MTASSASPSGAASASGVASAGNNLLAPPPVASASQAPALAAVFPSSPPPVCRPRPAKLRNPAASLATREERGLQKASDLAARGSVDKAIYHLQKLVRAVPTSTRGYLKMTALCRENKSPAEAFPLLESVVNSAPHLLVPREALAEVCLEAGRWDEAIRHGRELLRLSPRSLLARELLSAAYLQKGQFDDALRLTDEMVRLDPDDPSHHFKRGVLLQQKGQVGAAVLAFGRVLDMAPQGSEATDEACAALEMLDSHQIRQIITLAVEDIPFRVALRHHPMETVLGKGFLLSPAGMSALHQIRFDDLPDPPPGWRHYRYH